MQIIRNNFTLKLLSLSLAIIGWAYVRYASNPIIGTRFDQQISVPIAAVNVAPGDIAQYAEKEAVVTVVGKRGSAPVKPDQIKALLDLSNKAPGVYNLPVALVAPDVAVQSLSPASVTLTLERIESRTFPVIVHYSGLAAKTVISASPSFMPATVVASGPASKVSRIAAVRVDVPMASAPESFDEMIRPRAVGSDGSTVSGVTVTPDLVRVRLQLVSGSTEHATP